MASVQIKIAIYLCLFLCAFQTTALASLNHYNANGSTLVIRASPQEDKDWLGEEFPCGNMRILPLKRIANGDFSQVFAAKVKKERPWGHREPKKSADAPFAVKVFRKDPRYPWIDAKKATRLAKILSPSDNPYESIPQVLYDCPGPRVKDRDSNAKVDTYIQVFDKFRINIHSHIRTGGMKNADGSMDVQKMQNYMAQMADPMAHAHSLTISHLDIHLKNFMLDGLETEGKTENMWLVDWDTGEEAVEGYVPTNPVNRSPEASRGRGHKYNYMSNDVFELANSYVALLTAKFLLTAKGVEYVHMETLWDRWGCKKELGPEDSPKDEDLDPDKMAEFVALPWKEREQKMRQSYPRASEPLLTILAGMAGAEGKRVTMEWVVDAFQKMKKGETIERIEGY